MNKNTSTHGQITIWIVLGFFALLCVAISIYLSGNTRSELATQPQIIGGQTDDHGCLSGAGYSWCEARQECERVWERYCTTAEPKVASFTCEEGKTIQATFYPTDDMYVDLVLSDGKALTVPRATSASGARYAKSDESFVFWNKGDTAFITEDGATTFSSCVIEVQ